jgi:hypothetical protein
MEPVPAEALLYDGGDRSRYSIPPAMLQQILLLADPVAAATADRLRARLGQPVPESACATLRTLTGASGEVARLAKQLLANQDDTQRRVLVWHIPDLAVS